MNFLPSPLLRKLGQLDLWGKEAALNSGSGSGIADKIRGLLGART